MENNKDFFVISDTTTDSNQPSPLVQLRLQAEREYFNLYDFIKRYDFETKEDVQRAITRTTMAVSRSPYLIGAAKVDLVASTLYQRAKKIAVSADAGVGKAKAAAGEMWYNYYAPKIRNRQMDEMFHVEHSVAKASVAEDNLMSIYKITASDIEKLRFFVIQCRMREKFPKALRRMLYVWSDKKKTGKSTFIQMLATCLNGSNDYQHCERYASDLHRELGIKDFTVPLISECNCVYMDECFFYDMKKSYNAFKNRITSTGGRARLPYGTEFEWFGNPNYAVSSNNDIATFVQDKSDRRFLTVNFKEQPTEMDFDELFGIIRDFCQHTVIPLNLSIEQWARMMDGEWEVEGDEREKANDLAILMQQNEFFNEITIKAGRATSECSNDNKATVAALHTVVCGILGPNKDITKKDVKAAVIEVFGEPQEGRSWWSYRAMLQRLNEQKINEANNATESRPF